MPAVVCTCDDLIGASYDPDQDFILRRVVPISVWEQDSDQFNILGMLELWHILNMHILGAEICEQILSELEPSGFRSQISGLSFKC